MKLNVKLFAQARDAVGENSVLLDVPDDARVADLRESLGKTCPQIAPLIPNLLIAVDNEYADDSLRINGEQEFACFPPVSGG
ncbi:MAG: MoaD/ThiS family protein [Planctomycetes bacterium]|nr:MoaD/ThiS family protein [Planctomycetota bacterium]